MPLEEATFRFGSTPTADRAAAEQLQQQGPILEQLIGALQEREDADAHLHELGQVSALCMVLLPLECLGGCSALAQITKRVPKHTLLAPRIKSLYPTGL